MILIDDDPDFAEVIRLYSESLGFDVECPANGQAFKRALEAKKPDIILLDIVMPDVEGTELLLWMVDRKDTSAVITMSGYDKQYTAVAEVICTRGGLNLLGQLGKPFPLAELGELLQPVLKINAG